MKPPELERFIGIETYKSKCPGIGGKIKRYPRDFIVEEITPEGKILDNKFKFEDSEGEYLYAILKKENWSTLRAVREISKKLGISRKRIGFAGTKDKRALTTQMISIRNVSKDLKISIPNIEVLPIRYSSSPIKLGDLYGNRFTIKIRDIKLDKEEIKERVDRIRNELKAGFPNFFGIQRFGSVRPVTHLVGKEILKGNFRNAVLIYLTKTFERESEEAKRARNMLKEGKDFRNALKNSYDSDDKFFRSYKTATDINGADIGLFVFGENVEKNNGFVSLVEK